MAQSVSEVFRKLLENKENCALQVTKKEEKFVLVQFWQRSENELGKKGAFLLEIVNNPKGFKDRLFEVNGEEFEVFKVTLALVGKRKTLRISESLVELGRNIRKKSLDLGDPEELIRKTVFSKVERILDGKTASVKIWKFAKKIGKEFFASFCQEIQSWVICVGKKCVLFKDAEFSGSFGKSLVDSKLKQLVRERFGEELKAGISGLTLHGFVPYSNEPTQFFGLIYLDLNSSYMDHDPRQLFFETYGLTAVESSVLGVFEQTSELFSSLFAEFSQNPENVLSETYFLSEHTGHEESLKVISYCKIEKKLKHAQKFLVSKLKYLKSNQKSFEIRALEGIANKFEVSEEWMHNIFVLYRHAHPELLVTEGEQHLASEQIANGLPILLVSGYSFKDSKLLSEFLGYKLQKYKRGGVLEANTIYETEDITENLFISQQSLAVFVQWDSESKVEFLKSVKSMKKYELPQNLMRYSKKSGEDAMPAIENIYEEMIKKIRHFQQLQPSFIIELSSQYPSEDFKEVYNRLKKLPTFNLQAKAMNQPEETKEEVLENVPICFILIPMGIPGMGKTHIMPIVRKTAISAGFEFFVLSSDEIKNRGILEYRKKNLGSDHEKALIKSSKSSTNFYYNELFTRVKQNNGKLFIYLDKNHPPSGFQALLKRLKAEPIKNTLVNLIALAPQCKSDISLPHKHYEFSVEYLVACLYRAIKRDPHLTLIGSPTKIASVVLGMFSLYKNHSFVSDLDDGNIQYLIQAPFVTETGNWLPEELKTSVLNKIKRIKTDLDAVDNELTAIIEEIMKLDIPECDNIEIIEEEISKILKNVKITQSAVPEEKKVQKKASKGPVEKTEKPKIVNKNPVYIGICAEQAVRNAAIDILLGTLEKLKEFYHEKCILRDITEISALKAQGASKWKPPNSYHITAMFIGGSQEKYKSAEYNSFVPDLDTNIVITHIVYSPGSIACAKAEVLSPQVSIENKFPHITLLLGNRPAKHSNVILQHVNFDGEFSRSSFKEQKNEQIVFSYKLPEPLNITGKTKYFYG